VPGYPPRAAIARDRRASARGLRGKLRLKTVAFAFNAVAVLIGLMSFYGLWAIINDLRAAIGWWCIPAVVGGLAPWILLWWRIARHMYRLPDADPHQQRGLDAGLLDKPMQSLALVLILTTPLFVYLFVRGLML
jgi:hypothetical protein